MSGDYRVTVVTAKNNMFRTLARTRADRFVRVDDDAAGFDP
jgi:hypothetical protein